MGNRITLSYQGGNSDKVWEASVRDGVLHVRFGRRGRKMQEKEIFPPYKAGDARSEMVRRAKNKLMSGYVVQEWEDEDGESDHSGEDAISSSAVVVDWGETPSWFL